MIKIPLAVVTFLFTGTSAFVAFWWRLAERLCLDPRDLPEF
jgi:hypothetical protein